MRRNILPPGKEGIEKLESAVQRESDMTQRRRHGGRCGSGGGAASERAGRRLEPQRAGEDGGGEGLARRLPGGGAAGYQLARPRPRPRLEPQPAREKGRPALRISPQGSPAAFPGQGQILLEGKGTKR